VEGSCKYIELPVADSGQGAVLRHGGWAEVLKIRRNKNRYGTKFYTAAQLRDAVNTIIKARNFLTS
jgi:hypothetical protein